MRARDLKEPDTPETGMLQPGGGLVGGTPHHVRVVPFGADRGYAHQALEAFPDTPES
jgi:hypothetical protein